MADAIISGAADCFLGRLASLAERQVELVWGVTQELEDLKRTLLIIKALLHDADQMERIGSTAVKLWLGSLEDVIDEAEDLMDDFSNEDLRRKVMFAGNETIKKVRIFFSSSNQIAFRLKMAYKIEDLKKKLNKIKDDAKFTSGILPPPTNTNHVKSIDRDTHSYLPDEENVIGRNDEKMEILKLLDMDNIENEIKGEVLVIPIVGVGGLGKTTLAQLVFNDNIVKEHFDLRMWVCVSEDFDVNLLLKKIIQNATGNSNAGNFDQRELLRKELHDAISGKMYLLVLDDVWSDDDTMWQNLKELLAVGKNGSRIILTTRNETVARIASPTKLYRLGILDEERSWALFNKVAFKEGEEPEDSITFGEFRKELVRKCGGVPLAIKVIGRMLYFKNREEWLSFVKNDMQEIYQNKNEQILQTLKLSYDHLPLQLKPCFVYCSLFPKDYEIRVEMLIKLWMAQGIIIKLAGQKKCIEDVGFEYFENLLWRSFFQEVQKDKFGKIISFKMHDFIHDLAESLVKEKCIKLCLINGGSNIDNEARHLSFDFRSYSFDQIFPTFGIQAKRIRSILLSHGGYFYLIKKGSYESFCKKIVITSKFLRFLDLYSLKIKRIPNSIGELKYLRYLDLSNNEFQNLPNSITRLLNLQTLKLNWCRSLKELPRDIKRLVNLRHLETDGCYSLTHMPSGLSQLTNLQTLSTFVLKEGTGSSSAEPSAELNELAGLKLRNKLTIKNLRHGTDSKVANFGNKIHVGSLNLLWAGHAIDDASTVEVVDDYEMTLEGIQPLINLKEMSLNNYGGVVLPGWLPSTFSHLVRFELYSCENCKQLPPLNQFCSLEELRLGDMPALEYVNNDSFATETMPSLKTLRLENLRNLKSWYWKDIASRGQDDSFPSMFPCLSYLYIHNCPELSYMPLYPYADFVWLKKTNRLKPLEETLLLMNAAAVSLSTTVTTEGQGEEALPSTSSTVISTSLSKLESLILEDIENLQSLPEVKGLTSLKRLKIYRCPKLKYLSSFIQHLSSLQSLEIDDCDEPMDIFNDEYALAWQGLRSLSDISLLRHRQVEGLPEGIQRVTTVQSLYLFEFGELMVIPDWIGNCSSLTKLSIWRCPGVTSLPESIQGLTSLRTLQFGSCPNLSSVPESIQGLTSLRTLGFYNCPNLRSLPESIQGLTSLETLSIWECPNLSSVPESIQGISSLKRIAIGRCPDLWERCKDWPKVVRHPRDIDSSIISPRSSNKFKIPKLCFKST